MVVAITGLGQNQHTVVLQRAFGARAAQGGTLLADVEGCYRLGVELAVVHRLARGDEFRQAFQGGYRAVAQARCGRGCAAGHQVADAVVVR
ncbi:hypothetical protein D3C80_926510 [compost metagenome]